ncbi:MAG: hypothetical protein M3198_06225 [Actinomycetota bacterium]|nr:hypothetical protein [Actinomycetota bacterium]
MRTRRTARRWLRGAVLLAIPVALLGELGHHLLERLGSTFAHHFFHIVFGAGAFLLFALVVAADVRRNGWPVFSWRLRPSPPPSAGAVVTRGAADRVSKGKP